MILELKLLRHLDSGLREFSMVDKPVIAYSYTEDLFTNSWVVNLLWPPTTSYANVSWKGEFCFRMSVYRKTDTDTFRRISTKQSSSFSIYSKPEVYLKQNQRQLALADDSLQLESQSQSQREYQQEEQYQQLEQPQQEEQYQQQEQPQHSKQQQSKQQQLQRSKQQQYQQSKEQQQQQQPSSSAFCSQTSAATVAGKKMRNSTSNRGTKEEGALLLDDSASSRKRRRINTSEFGESAQVSHQGMELLAQEEQDPNPFEDTMEPFYMYDTRQQQQQYKLHHERELFVEQIESGTIVQPVLSWKRQTTSNRSSSHLLPLSQESIRSLSQESVGTPTKFLNLSFMPSIDASTSTTGTGGDVSASCASLSQEVSSFDRGVLLGIFDKDETCTGIGVRLSQEVPCGTTSQEANHDRQSNSRQQQSNESFFAPVYSLSQ